MKIGERERKKQYFKEKKFILKAIETLEKERKKAKFVVNHHN